MRWRLGVGRDVDEELSAFLDGALSGGRLRAFERRLAGDPRLQERLRQLRLISEAARRGGEIGALDDFPEYFAAIARRVGEEVPGRRPVMGLRWALVPVACVVGILGWQLLSRTVDDDNTEIDPSVAEAPKAMLERREVSSDASAELSARDAAPAEAQALLEERATESEGFGAEVIVESAVAGAPDSIGETASRVDASASVAVSPVAPVESARSESVSLARSVGGESAPTTSMVVNRELASGPKQEASRGRPSGESDDAAVTTAGDSGVVIRGRIVAGEQAVWDGRVSVDEWIRIALQGRVHEVSLTHVVGARWRLTSAYSSDGEKLGSRERYFDLPLGIVRSEGDPIVRIRMAQPPGLDAPLFVELFHPVDVSSSDDEESADEAR